MKEVVLDTETTGLSVKDGHRIVEIGCVELDNLIPTSKKFHCYLNPRRKVSEKAFKIHGYSDEFLLIQKKFLDICDEFLNFIKDKKLKKLQLPLETKKKKSNFIIKNNFKSMFVKKNVKIIKNKILKNERSSS